MYDVIGLVETHVGVDRVPDVHARAIAQGYNASTKPTMKFKDSLGNHGGELLLTSRHTYLIPIDNIVLENAKNANDETPRFTTTEVRYGQMSILVIIVYFWCSEGLSARNSAILQQISALLNLFRLPFLFFADFNMEPEHIRQSGWLAEHRSMLLLPDVATT